MIPLSRALRTVRMDSGVTRSRRAAFVPVCAHRYASTDPSIRYITRDDHDAAIRGNGKSDADLKVEEITELFATAQDEFEIAFEETEKVSVYAEADRKAAWEEFTKTKEAFDAVVNGGNADLAEEVKRRIGHRIRELEQGMGRLDELAKSQD